MSEQTYDEDAVGVEIEQQEPFTEQPMEAPLELSAYWGPVYDDLVASRDQGLQITITCEKADTKGVVTEIAEDWVAMTHDPGIGSKEQRFWIARHQINRVIVPTGN